MASRSRLAFLAFTLAAATLAFASKPSSMPASGELLRVTSGTPGHEVIFRGVLLVAGEPMRIVEQSTPFEFRPNGELTLGAFEPRVEGVTLRLELQTDAPEPAGVTAPRVMVGVRIGGVATDFVQGY
jgi:hypothetical protein